MNSCNPYTLLQCNALNRIGILKSVMQIILSTATPVSPAEAECNYPDKSQDNTPDKPEEDTPDKPEDIAISSSRPKRRKADRQRLLELQCQVYEGELVKQKLQIELLQKLIKRQTSEAIPPFSPLSGFSVCALMQYKFNSLCQRWSGFRSTTPPPPPLSS